MSATTHLVLFYRDQAELVSELASYVEEALDDSGSAVVIATREHRFALQAALELGQAQPAPPPERLLLLDAGQTLDLFMSDGRPDPIQFAHVIGGLLDHHQLQIGPVHLYGEMVALLWDQGNTEGALALEDLWGEVLQDTPYRLLCAYPIEDTLNRRPDGLAQIAQRHTSVHMSG